jgi:hypothetical protein
MLDAFILSPLMLQISLGRRRMASDQQLRSPIRTMLARVRIEKPPRRVFLDTRSVTPPRHEKFGRVRETSARKLGLTTSVHRQQDDVQRGDRGAGKPIVNKTPEGNAPNVPVDYCREIDNLAMADALSLAHDAAAMEPIEQCPYAARG